nr:putative ribonuclease H-like domain-containing protein [Tanacetum cinerariifolium]
KDTNQSSPPPIAPPEAPQMVSSVKLPILKKSEYILWTMKMEQYLAHIDYALWKVILNGNGEVQMTKDEAGNEVEVPLVTAQQILARTRERKPKSTLLMAIPAEHLARFYRIKDAKTLWAAIKTRFGGNAESKKMQKNVRNLGNRGRDDGNAGYKGRDNGKRHAREEDEKELVAQDGLGTYDWSYQLEEEATEFALMAFTSNPSSSSSSNSEAQPCSKQCYQYGLELIEGQLRVHQQNEVIYEEKIGVLEYDVKDKSNLLKYTQKQLDEALREKEDLKAKQEKFETSSKNLTKLLNSQINAKVKTGLGYDSQFNEKEMLEVKEEEVTEIVFDNCSSDEENSLANDRVKKDRMAKKYVLPNNVGKGTGHKESRPVWNNVQRINHQNKFAQTTVFTRSRRIPVSAAKPKAAALTSAAKPVNTAGTKQSVNFSNSRIGSKAVSVVKGNEVTAVKASAGCVWRPRVNEIDQIYKDNMWISTHVDYVDPQGQLKHMTGNKAYLADYQEINDGGFVAFGLSRGKITGKGKIRTENSNYAGDNLDRKSTIEGYQFFGRRLISWQCKKQTIVATSTTEAEYVPAANCYGQILWIQNQMLDYGFNFMNTKIYIDNESTICIVKNPVYHSKSKHIEIRHHFIRDSYEKKLIQVLKKHTEKNVADLLTKILMLAEKTEGNAEFHQIVDFLRSSFIHHALIISPTIYAFNIKQFWNSANSQTINDEKKIHAIVDGKIVIFENLSLMGYEGALNKPSFQKSLFSPQWNQIPESSSSPQNTQSHRQTLKGTGFPHTRRSNFPDPSVDVKAVYKEGVTVWPEVSAARPEVITAEPKTPSTTTTLFDDEDVTIADTLVKMKSQKAKEKGVDFKEANDSARPIRFITTLQPLPTIDPKDKDLDEKVRTKRERQLEASKVALAKLYDEVQAQIDVDHELAARLTHEEQEMYIVEEMSKLFTHAQLKSRSFKEIQKLHTKEQKWVDAFVPIGSEEDKKRVRSRKKRAAGSSSKQKSPKKQKVNDQEFVDSDKELVKCLKVVLDDDKAINYETLDVKSIIVDCESQVLGTIDAVLDRQDVLDLHKIVMERLPANDLEEKRYPLTKEILEKMLSWRLEAETKSTLALDLIKFFKLQIRKKLSVWIHPLGDHEAYTKET